MQFCSNLWCRKTFELVPAQIQHPESPISYIWSHPGFILACTLIIILSITMKFCPWVKYHTYIAIYFIVSRDLELHVILWNVSLNDHSDQIICVICSLLLKEHKEALLCDFTDLVCDQKLLSWSKVHSNIKKVIIPDLYQRDIKASI